MKIAYVCADPGIPVFGSKGASIHIQEVVRVLLKRGASVTLFAQRTGGSQPEALRGVNVVSLPALPAAAQNEERVRAALKANAVVADLLTAHGPFDLVYERYSLWSYAGMAWARQAGIPAILEVNAPLIEEQRKYREMLMEQEAREVLATLLSAAGTIIAVSPGVKRWLETVAATANNVHVVANGVDPARFRQRAIARQGTLTVGFLGTLKPWHGLRTLIDAFIQLRQQGYSLNLSIIGDGPEAASLSATLASHELLAVTHFSGAVSPAAVPELLAEMDIAVAPYPQLENFYFSPLKIYEYMAAGLPVITTRVGHLADIVREGETGLLVPPEDPQALAGAIVRLLQDPALRLRMGTAGRQYVEDGHSWERVVTHILQLASVRWVKAP